MSGFRPCALIPVYDNPATLARVVEDCRRHVDDVLVVDDGSAAPTQRVLDELQMRTQNARRVHVVRRARNGGKGAALKTGFAAALDLGFTHAVQLDADGQHEAADIPRFLDAARAEPDALILGMPRFGADAPKARLYGRLVSVFFVHLETGGRTIADPLCGYRVYPLAAASACAPRGDHMEFDPEIAVRMVWSAVPVRNVPTAVRYIAKSDGGVSHFRVVRDNLRISLMHSRLMCTMIMRRLFGWLLPALRAPRLELSSEARRANNARGGRTFS